MVVKQKFKFIYCDWSCGAIVVVCKCGLHYKVGTIKLWPEACSKCRDAINYINKAHNEGWLPTKEQVEFWY